MNATTPSIANGSAGGLAAGSARAQPNAAHPGSYPRRALVCVAGLAPSVVTETLYALAVQERESFIPTEIHVITTTRGAEKLQETLLAQPGGHFHALQREYLGAQAISFGPEQVHLIEREGRALDDIDSPEDSTAAADTILNVVRGLAADPSCAIHASIAGGRKSMAFLLGMSMALLGRSQDRLSHVLVNAPFEMPQFFFPPRVPVLLDIGGRKVSTAEARITLAPINVVRVFDGLGRSLTDGGSTYDELVRLGQLELQRPQIRILPAQGCLEIEQYRCELKPQLMFFYTLLALRRQSLASEPGVSKAKAGAVVVRPGASIGFSGPAFEAARKRFPGMESNKLGANSPKRLRELVSAINNKIDAAFGPMLAKRARIIGPQVDHRDGHYGLLDAEPGDIYLG